MPAFSALGLRLGMILTVLGAVLLYHALMGESTNDPQGEIPQWIFQHYGPKGLLIASGLAGAATLPVGVWVLVRYFQTMPRRRRK